MKYKKMVKRFAQIVKIAGVPRCTLLYEYNNYLRERKVYNLDLFIIHLFNNSPASNYSSFRNKKTFSK